MKLVVGLGNPGRQYAGTRHNVGFEVIDAFARGLGWIVREDDFDRLARSNFSGLMLDGTRTSPGASEKVVLLKPTTYMNLSGDSVQAAVRFFQVAKEDLMIVLDDMALPAGKLRLRPGGSSGGHNGLSDIERKLGTSGYPRLRIGIDSPPPRVPSKDYVLGRYTDEQRRAIEAAKPRAVAALELWMDKGITAAMNQFNADDGENKAKP